jgi:hypothetical protein
MTAMILENYKSKRKIFELQLTGCGTGMKELKEYTKREMMSCGKKD